MLSPPGTHFTVESTKAMLIKCLDHGNNIQMSGFEQSTSVSRNRHSSHMTNMLHIWNNCFNAHRWNKKFLGSTTENVFDNMSWKERRLVKSDVPQSTVLGPLLFLIYINDIESQITSSLRLFANDSALCTAIHFVSDSLTYQEDVFKFQKWANTWQMSFNVNKCKLQGIT